MVIFIINKDLLAPSESTVFQCVWLQNYERTPDKVICALYQVTGRTCPESDNAQGSGHELGNEC